MVNHKHKFENIFDHRVYPSNGRDVQILMCYECQTVKIIYEGIKPKYVRKGDTKCHTQK